MIAGWLALAPADGVVSHESALELLDLTDLIADEVHVTLPRAKRGLRTLTDMLRSGGWTEQTDLAIRQAIRRGLTTRRRLEAELPAKWRSRLDATLARDAT
ncbi:MAG: hypothetical protein ACLQBY_18290 [Solirubrobacteraceae bacterium]